MPRAEIVMRTGPAEAYEGRGHLRGYANLVPAAQTRLVPQSWKWWKGKYPIYEPSALTLEGELLRFVFP